LTRGYGLAPVVVALGAVGIDGAGIFVVGAGGGADENAILQATP